MINCLQEFESNLINHLKAQFSELETDIKAIFLSLDTKIETGDKQTVFTEPPEQLPSPETEGEITAPEEETGDEMINYFDLIEQQPLESQRESFSKKAE